MHGDIKKGRPETGDAKQIIHDIRCDVALDWAQKELAPRRSARRCSEILLRTGSRDSEVKRAKGHGLLTPGVLCTYGRAWYSLTSC
jgi:hypothetical protein